MSEQNKNNKTVTFLDSVGRLIFGIEVSEKNTEKTIAVQNPVVLHITNENERMSVRILPTIFREFLADKTQDCIVNYPLDNICTTNIKEFDFRLNAQYEQMFNPNNMFVPPQQEQSSNQKEQPKIVNLFDE
jgi:hypothetical protein